MSNKDIQTIAKFLVLSFPDKIKAHRDHAALLISKHQCVGKQFEEAQKIINLLNYLEKLAEE